MTPQPASFNHIDYSARPWVAGDRLRRKRLGWLCCGRLGDLATYEGGADYVPGLDAGQYAVKLDQPNGRGHRGEAYWDLPSLQADWDRIIEKPAPRSNGKASTTSKTPLNEESHLASKYDTSGDPLTDTALDCASCDVGSNECRYVATDDTVGCLHAKSRFSTHYHKEERSNGKPCPLGREGWRTTRWPGTQDQCPGCGRTVYTRADGTCRPHNTQRWWRDEPERTG